MEKGIFDLRSWGGGRFQWSYHPIISMVLSFGVFWSVLFRLITPVGCWSFGQSLVLRFLGSLRF